MFSMQAGNANNGNTNNNNNTGNGITPKRLELSLNPADGSLLTASLASVLLGTTDGLYQDLYDMAHGEVATATAAVDNAADEQQQQDQQQDGSAEQQPNATTTTTVYATKPERLANLSFAQRRHEVSWRLAQHAKAVQHVSALTGAAAISDALGNGVRLGSQALQHSRTAWVQADTAQDALYFDIHALLFPQRAGPHDVYGALDVLLEGKWYDLPYDLQLATDAEYATSREATYTKQELEEEWNMVVRQKLVTGEMGWQRRRQQQQQQSMSSLRTIASPSPSPLWKISLRGGTVKLTSGRPKTLNGRTIYPLEALLTVLSPSSVNDDDDDVNNTNHNTSSDDKTQPNTNNIVPEWTLLSLHVQVSPKTGEGNHQLELSNRQRYDLHRLAALAMSREESRVRQHIIVQQQNADDNDNKNIQQPIVARPLDKLFQVSHTFLLSWQLQVLSAQAQALRRGVWSATRSNHPITVQPVVVHTVVSATTTTTTSEPHTSSSATTSTTNNNNNSAAAANNQTNSTTDTENNNATNNNNNNQVIEEEEEYDNECLGTVSIGFWKIDDAYGSPAMGDLDLASPTATTTSAASTTTTTQEQQQSPTTSSRNPQQLTLSIRAHPLTGMKVSLSGGALVMEQAAIGDDGVAEGSAMLIVNNNNNNNKKRWRGLIRDLLAAASDPFCLSASDALLAATRLCAQLKCHAVVQALHQSKALPPWMHVTASDSCSRISVAAHVQYHRGGVKTPNNAANTSNNGNGDNHHHVGPMTQLFCMACDARTGSFVVVFESAMVLLRELASGVGGSSSGGGGGGGSCESLQLRMASVPANRRRVVGATSSGRVVKDAFDGCIRSLNLLGQRTGVGGDHWDDVNEQSASLRQRAIQSSCADVQVSLAKCCGLAAQYGLAPLAMGVATGVQALADVVGPAVEQEGLSLLAAPPVSLMLEQEIVETSRTTTDGVKKKDAHLSQSFFSVACSCKPDQGLELIPLEILVTLPSPTDAPVRELIQVLSFEKEKDNTEPPAKRVRIETDTGNAYSKSVQSIQTETDRFAEILLDMDILAGLDDDSLAGDL